MGTARARRVVVVGLVAVLLALVGCDLGAPPTSYSSLGALTGIADATGDGSPDIITTTNTEYGILVGDGAGGFTPGPTGAIEQCVDSSEIIECQGQRVSLADANDDGAEDLLIWRRLSYNPPPPGDQHVIYEMHVKLNDGTGNLGPALGDSGIQYPINLPDPFLTVVDVNGDGFPDVVITQPGAGVRVRLGDGAGAFGPAIQTSVAPFFFGTVEAADLNGDGHNDLVLSGSRMMSSAGEEQFRGFAGVMLGAGDGTFGPPDVDQLVDDIAVDQVDVEIADIDEDGDLDLVGGNLGSTFDTGGPVSSYSVFTNDGTGSLSGGVSHPAISETSHLSLGEFDGDGHLDMVANVHVPGGDSSQHLHWGDGTGSFSGDHLLPSPGEAADLDGDGKSDFVTNPSVGVIDVFLNRWEGRPE